MRELLTTLAARGRPLRVGVVGAGKFATMFLAQARRQSGLEIEGTRHEPGFHLTTPDDVWERYGARVAGADARMFTSFTDGTKSAIELAAGCNATGLEPPEDGLRFPRADRHELPLLPARLSRTGTVEAVAGEDLRWAVFVVFAAHDELARRTLDGEGVYCAYGMLVPSARSIGQGLLPIGLTHGARVTRPVPAGEIITVDGVELDLDERVLQLREETVHGSRLAEGSTL